MADKPFKVEVFSTRGLEFEHDVTMVIVPGSDGEIGFLADHCEYVGVLGAGIMQCVANSNTYHMVVMGGVCKFSDNKLTILADEVDLPGELNLSQIAASKSTLTQELEKINMFDPGWDIISLKIKRLESVEKLQQIH